MLSFTPGQKLENELRVLQGEVVEIYKDIDGYHRKKLTIFIALR